MPRSSGRSSARPSSSSRSAPSNQQRGSHSAAYPAQQQQAFPAQAGAAQGKPPGMLAQAASTMGGAMAGSVVGHGISNMLFGGRSAEQPPPPAEYANQARETTGNCDIPAKDFTKCLEATGGDMTSCGYYLEALKACQAAAKPY